jgi:hypothetical protein
MVQARSISLAVRGSLARGPRAVSVLGVWERACALATYAPPSSAGGSSDAGGVIALVLPEVGDGPLNIVVEPAGRGWRGLRPGVHGRITPGALHAGPLIVDLDGARTWDPCPDWPDLRRRCEEVRPALEQLRGTALRHAPEGSLLELLSAAPRPAEPLAAGVLAEAGRAAQALAEGWAGDRGRLQAAAARLAGLGQGLTPAGDDWLVGAMLWAWLAHPDPDRACALVAEAAAPRTTALSAAYLRAAAAGQCSAAWHRLLPALCGGAQAGLEEAAQGVLAAGHTSGADALAGFLYAGLYSVE